MAWLARLHPLLAIGLVVGLLCGSIAFRIESWPFSAYPMYSVPKAIAQVEFSRFAFELGAGNVVLWKPRFEYIAKDLNGMIERDRGRPGFQAKLESAARLVLADLAHDRQIEDPSRIQRVLVLSRRVRPSHQGESGWTVEDRVIAAYDVEELR